MKAGVLSFFIRDCIFLSGIYINIYPVYLWKLLLSAIHRLEPQSIFPWTLTHFLPAFSLLFILPPEL